MKLLLEFESDYHRFLKEGPARIVERFERVSSFARGKRVRVANGRESFLGTTVGLAPEGLLRVRRDEGETVTVIAGDVSEAR